MDAAVRLGCGGGSLGVLLLKPVDVARLGRLRTLDLHERHLDHGEGLGGVALSPLDFLDVVFEVAAAIESAH